METYLNSDTLPRLSDYLRLKEDSKLEAALHWRLVDGFTVQVWRKRT